MVSTIRTLTTNTWVKGSWDDFMALLDSPEIQGSSKNVRTYYDSGWMRIETMPIGSAHGQDNSILASALSLYTTLKSLTYVSFTGSNFRKLGERECQPNLAYYIGESIQRPQKNNQAVDIDIYGPPTLAIEISATTLEDDLGPKRLLYERLGVQEYWVVNVEAAEVIAFKMEDGGSRQIKTSSALPGLSINIIEEALQRSTTEDDGTINRWLFQQFG